MTNPLLMPWTGPEGLPDFGAFTDADFAPAVEAALAQSRANIDAIAADPAPASFDNVIKALERADATLNRVLSVFYTLAGTDSNPAREGLQRDFAPLLSAYGSFVANHTGLFARLEALWQARETLGLNAEESRVLMLTHRGFIRSGARLKGDKADRLSAVKSRLASIGTQFSQNLLTDERTWHLDLSADDLDGLPDWLVSAAVDAARDVDAHARITASRSLVVPFLQYSSRRDLRARAYAGFTERGMMDPERDNIALAKETLDLRYERAQLLGYASYADYKLETEMAKTPDAVDDLLRRVWAPARAAAEKQAAQLTELLHADGHNGPLEGHDWRYYSEKLRVQEYDFDAAELKPYFQLDAMIAAAFDCATRLFGLTFEPFDATLHHVDARAWTVHRNGAKIATFVGDYFARPSKRSGAWCSALQSQNRMDGEVLPIVNNVCNFVKPAPGEPALLSFDDARTLFHEFGHALHQMLSNVTYDSISGTSVSRDFVELPSQLYEHWLEVPEVLKTFARHAKTGAELPQDLLDKMTAAQNFEQPFSTVEFLASAMVDLAYHRGAPPADIAAEQARILADIGMPAAIAMRHATPQFAHVFSGDGYASAYYSYMWSEVMDADAFAAFEEAGDPFDAATAARLENFILSKGGSQEGADLYTAFRGKMPTIEPLLRGRGLA